MEEWRDCVGFEGFYQVSNEGRIRSIAVYSAKYNRVIQRKTPHYNSIETTRDGYKRVLLCLYGVHHHCAVHRLVAQAFIPNPENLKEVNHKDENPSNNMLSNLEWCSREYNANYGTLPKRISKRSMNAEKSSKAVFQYSLDGTFITAYPSAKEAQRQTGANADVICRVCKGKAKQSGGFRWSYAGK